MKSQFDYYTTDRSIKDCARWISYIRLFTYVRTPACIYSKIKMPSSKQVYRNVHVIAVPEYISNILVECFNEVSAREAALNCYSRLSTVDAGMLRDLYIETGVIPFRDHNSTFKPRDVWPYGLSKSTVVRLGASLVEVCAREIQCDVAVLERTVAAVVTQMGQDVVEAAPLWPDEWLWLRSTGGHWTRGVIHDES